MQRSEVEALRAGITTLEGQRALLGDMVVDLALAPLRTRLASLLRPAGVRRRQITVLFADVVGSTAIAQGLAAEDTLTVLNDAMQRMAALVQAHRGRVLRFTGDGLKAAFGMDEVREDDPERAVLAGLAILQAGQEMADAARRLHGIAHFALRVGVHTGDVALGAGVEADNTAMGAAVNIAARMEQSAPPGALRISHDTWNHVRGLFDVQAQPPLEVKGVDAPMQTYLVQAARDRQVAAVERGLQGLHTPLVGREGEMQRLHDTVARVRQTRQAQALTLVGDAGVGKSRLLREFLAGLKDGQVLLSRFQPDGALRPWGLLRGLLVAQFGIADTDSADVARRKVVEGLAPGFDDHAERQAQLIGQLSGLDFGDSPHLRGVGPRALRDQAFAAVRAWLQGLAARGPLPLLVVEDLHWADDGSLDLLQHLLAPAAEPSPGGEAVLPLALVMTARPALLAHRPDWGLPDTRLPLAPLAAAPSAQLVQALLQRLDTVPVTLSALIVGQAEGNPYYMEELVRRLVDDGAITVDGPRWTLHQERLQDLRLPGTLVGLLQARLDTLPVGDRRAARQASVIGHVFWDDALQALDTQAVQALPALQRAAFVRTQTASDFEGTTQRQFDHHLLHQVTYDTVLKAERRLGHAAAARWLTERTQGRGAEFVAMTGEHAERAGETALAIDCFEQAGREAEGRFANAAAVAWTRRALDLLGESQAPRRFDLLSRLGKIADTLGDRSAQDRLIDEMAALLERHPDDFASAGRFAQQSFELAEQCGAALPAALSQYELAWLKHQFERDNPGALEHVRLGLQWAARIDAGAGDLRAITEAQLMSRSAQISVALGRLVAARETLLAVLSRGEELESPRLQVAALLHLASIAERVGRWDEAAAFAQRIRSLAGATGQRQMVGKALAILGRAAEGLGNPAEALRCREQVLGISREVGDRYFEAFVLYTLGMSHLEVGNASAALQWYAQARAVFETIPLAPKVFECRASMALCQARLGDTGPALTEVEQVLAYQAANPSKGAGQYLDLGWHCQQVIAAAGDARAGPMLDALFAEMQTCACELATAAEFTDPADRERLIQALPVFRAIVSAHRRMHGTSTPLD
jgi:predicted ATPase/class 3 adenylate cyclase